MSIVFNTSLLRLDLLAYFGTNLTATGICIALQPFDGKVDSLNNDELFEEVPLIGRLIYQHAFTDFIKLSKLPRALQLFWVSQTVSSHFPTIQRGAKVLRKMTKFTSRQYKPH